MSDRRKISDDERRLQAAAIRFASDYGPLPAALQGDPKHERRWPTDWLTF